MKYFAILFSLFIGIMTVQSQPTNNQHKQTVVEGHFEDGSNDTLKIIFYEQRIAGTAAGSILLTCVVEKGHFKFDLPIKGQFSYVTIYPYKHPPLAFDYLVKKGDSNFISISRNKSKNGEPMLRFTGINCGAFKAKYQMDSAYFKEAEKAQHLSISYDSLKEDITYLMRKILPTSDIVANIYQTVLEKFKNGLDSEVYEILRTDYLFKTEVQRLNRFLADRGSIFRQPDSTARLIILKRYYPDHLQNITKGIKVSPTAKIVSRYYMEYKCLNAIANVLVSEDKNALPSAYPLITVIEQTDIAIREKLLTCTIADLGSYNDVNDKDSLIRYAIKRIKDPYLYNVVLSYYDRSMKGRDAFVFKLEDKNGKLVSLKDFKGKTVLLDFWFTGCFGCTQVEKGLKKVKDVFGEDSSIVFISISVDKEKEKWLQGLQSGLYSDGRGYDLYTNGEGFDHEITKYYYISSYPRLMLIDPQGKLFAFNANRPGIDLANKKLIDQIKSVAR